MEARVEAEPTGGLVQGLSQQQLRFTPPLLPLKNSKSFHLADLPPTKGRLNPALKIGKTPVSIRGMVEER